MLGIELFVPIRCYSQVITILDKDFFSLGNVSHRHNAHDSAKSAKHNIMRNAFLIADKKSRLPWMPKVVKL